MLNHFWLKADKSWESSNLKFLNGFCGEMGGEGMLEAGVVERHMKK